MIPILSNMVKCVWSIIFHIRYVCIVTYSTNYGVRIYMTLCITNRRWFFYAVIDNFPLLFKNVSLILFEKLLDFGQVYYYS